MREEDESELGRDSTQFGEIGCGRALGEAAVEEDLRRVEGEDVRERGGPQRRDGDHFPTREVERKGAILSLFPTPHARSHGSLNLPPP